MSGSGPVVTTLTAVALKAWLDGGEAITVLDVREDDERALSAIRLPPTARDLHIPTTTVFDHLDDVRASTGQDPLVVYCHHGVRSRNVARWLVRQGMTRVHNLEGGIDAWSRSVDPGVPRY